MRATWAWSRRRRRRGLAPRPVVLGGHRADEARRAVPALGATALGHLALDRMQLPRPPQALRGHDLLLVERRGRHQAGIDRDPAGPPGPARSALPGDCTVLPCDLTVVAGDQHRAGPALALGAALLAPRQPAPAQPLEQGDMPAHLTKLTSPPVDHHPGPARPRLSRPGLSRPGPAAAGPAAWGPAIRDSAARDSASRGSTAHAPASAAVSPGQPSPSYQTVPPGERQRVLLAYLPTIAPSNPKRHTSMETYFRIMDIGRGELHGAAWMPA